MSQRFDKAFTAFSAFAKDVCHFLFKEGGIFPVAIAVGGIVGLTVASLRGCEEEQRRVAKTRLVVPCPDGGEVEVRQRKFNVERTTWEDMEGNELFRNEKVYESKP